MSKKCFKNQDKENISIIDISLKLRYNDQIWTVNIPKRVIKKVEKLPKGVRFILNSLLKEIELYGPYRSNWPNYSKLVGTKEVFHCHIKKGQPTYVAVWVIVDKKIKVTEVKYVGSHEKAPY